MSTSDAGISIWVGETGDVVELLEKLLLTPNLGRSRTEIGRRSPLHKRLQHFHHQGITEPPIQSIPVIQQRPLVALPPPSGWWPSAAAPGCSNESPRSGGARRRKPRRSPALAASAAQPPPSGWCASATAPGCSNRIATVGWCSPKEASSISSARRISGSASPIRLVACSSCARLFK